MRVAAQQKPAHSSIKFKRSRWITSSSTSTAYFADFGSSIHDAGSFIEIVLGKQIIPLIFCRNGE